MRLPWRKPGVFDENPWDEEVGLSGWTPGLSQQVDMMAMMTCMAKGQWELARWLESVSRVQTVTNRCMMISGIGWVFVAVVNLNYVYHWWN